MHAIAMAKGGDQFRIFLSPLGKQPLLELIDDQEHLPLGRQDVPPAQARQRIDQP